MDYTDHHDANAAGENVDFSSLPNSKKSEFSKEQFIGKGSYGSVWLIRRYDNNKLYALKEVNLKDKQDSEKIESFNEIRILASVKNPNIISYKESFIEDDILYIITEYADGSDLSKIIKMNQEKGTVFKEDFIWSVLIQTSLGLEYLHSRRILHRDLKPSNIFLSGNPPIVKIGDLGVAKLLKQSSTYTQVGTPFYICPEIWKHFPYNMKSDVWSLGCVLYEMCTSRRPFVAHSPKDLSRKILRGSYHPIQGFSKDLCGVIDKLLTVNCAERPTIAEVLRMPQVQKYVHLIPEECAPSPSHFSVKHVARPFPSYKSVIGTIKVPKALSRVKLPPPTYSTVKNGLESRVDEDAEDNDSVKKTLDFDLDSTSISASDSILSKQPILLEQQQQSSQQTSSGIDRFTVESVIDKSRKATVPKQRDRLFSFAPLPNLKPISIYPRRASVLNPTQPKISRSTPTVPSHQPLKLPLPFQKPKPKPSTSKLSQPSSSSNIPSSSIMSNIPKAAPSVSKPRRSIFAAPEPVVSNQPEANPPPPADAAKAIRKKRSLLPSAMEPVNLGNDLPILPPPHKKLHSDSKSSLPVPLPSKPRKSIFAPPSPQPSSIAPSHRSPFSTPPTSSNARRSALKSSPKYLLKSPIERFRMMFGSRIRTSPGSPSRRLRPPYALPAKKSPPPPAPPRVPKERRSIFAPPLNPVAPKYPYKPIRHAKPQVSPPARGEGGTGAAGTQTGSKYVLKKPRQSIFAPPEVPVPPLYPYNKKITKPPIFFGKRKSENK